MGQLFELLFTQPILNIFVGLYDVVGDVGIVIVVMTIAIKGLLWPMTRKSIEAQKSLQELQPKMKALKEQYKDDQQQMAQETMKLYKEHKVNPLGSCLPILIQLPVFLALYWVLRDGLTSAENFDLLYSFVPQPDHINSVSLGVIDLAKSSVVLAVAAGLAQFWQAKTLTKRRAPKAAGEGGKDEDMMAMMNKQMTFMMPVLIVFIGMSLPGGVALYWFLSTMTTAVQQYILFKKKDSGDDVIDGKIVS